jgi:hypothetical protein
MEKPLAQIAYEAYCENRKWFSFRGEVLPPWNQVDNGIREAWQAAAEAVEDKVSERYIDDE